MKKKPQKSEELIQKLRSEIYKKLSMCNAATTPNICELIANVDGYRAVEETIIGMVSRTGMSPSACIAQYETELNHV